MAIFLTGAFSPVHPPVCWLWQSVAPWPTHWVVLLLCGDFAFDDVVINY